MVEILLQERQLNLLKRLSLFKRKIGIEEEEEEGFLKKVNWRVEKGERVFGREDCRVSVGIWQKQLREAICE